MSYQLVYTKRAFKDIRRLNEQQKRRIKKALEDFRQAPFESPSLHKLANPEIGTYRLRVGDYRVILDIEAERLIVLRVGHRKDIYRGV